MSGCAVDGNVVADVFVTPAVWRSRADILCETVDCVLGKESLMHEARYELFGRGARMGIAPLAY